MAQLLEAEVLSQGAQIQFPAPTWWLFIIPRGFNALFWPLLVRHTCGTQTYAEEKQKSKQTKNTHKIKNNSFFKKVSNPKEHCPYVLTHSNIHLEGESISSPLQS